MGVRVPILWCALVAMPRKPVATLLRFREAVAQLRQTRPVKVMGRSWEASKLLVQGKDLMLIPTHAARGPALMMKVASLATSSCGASSHPRRPAAGPKKPHGRSLSGCDTPGMSMMILLPVPPA